MEPGPSELEAKGANAWTSRELPDPSSREDTSPAGFGPPG